MADKTEILKALRSLDAANVNHWTADGLARLETVRMLASDQTISREDVESAAPGFVKDTAATWVEPAQDAEGEPTGVPVPNTEDAAERLGVETSGAAGTNVDADGAPSGVPTPLTEGMVPAPPSMDAEGGAGAPTAPRQDDAPGGAELEQGQAKQPEVVAAGDGEDEVAALEAELAEVQEQLTLGRRYRDEVNTKIDELAKRESEVHDRLTTLRPAKTATSAIAEYLASRRQQVEQRGDVRQVLKDGGVDLAAIQKAVAPSPIDSAMARKRGHGTQRPQRAPVKG